MDNYTLLFTLIIILAVNAPFTAIVTRNTSSTVQKEWLFSALFLFAGFFLILMQGHLQVFISICIANYLILLGFYYQTSAALIMECKRKVISPLFLTGISILYWGLFLYYTLINFNTSMRIIIISLFLAVFYTHAVILMGRQYGSLERTLHKTRELFYLFCFSALFYTFRAIITAAGTGAVNSLFDMNLTTTISFLFIIVFNLSYMMGMFNASLRTKNHLLIREKEKLSSLFGFLNDAARHLNLDELYKSIEEILKSSMNIDTAAIFLIDEGKKSHSMSYVFNNLDLPLDSVKTLKKGEGSSGKAIEEDRVILIDVDNYPIHSVAEAYKAKGVSEFVSVPLKTSEGIIGAITIVYSQKNKSEFLDQEFFYYLGEQIALVLHNAFLYEKVSLLANTDPLTGLYNRRRMMEIFKQEHSRALRSGRGFTIVMADLDHFKKVNDDYGHECGDEVLRMTSALLREECRESDSICRWGGEEFLILFIDSDIPSAAGVSERIRLNLEERSISCRENGNITLSMGITAFHPDYTPEQTIANADEALYNAKKKGRNRIEIKES